MKNKKINSLKEFNGNEWNSIVEQSVRMIGS